MAGFFLPDTDSSLLTSNVPMTNLTTFNLNTATVRVVTMNDQPWFVAADISRCLGWSAGTLGNNFANLAADEKGVEVIDTPGGPQRLRLVAESGLYKLIMRSDKHETRAFQDWVTRDVLPAIRKDGMYVAGEEKVDVSDDE
jgi:prophage antirepressor-like protein